MGGSQTNLRLASARGTSCLRWADCMVWSNLPHKTDEPKSDAYSNFENEKKIKNVFPSSKIMCTWTCKISKNNNKLLPIGLSLSRSSNLGFSQCVSFLNKSRFTDINWYHCFFIYNQYWHIKLSIIFKIIKFTGVFLKIIFPYSTTHTRIYCYA